METTLDRVAVDELMAAGPVREFRRHRDGWVTVVDVKPAQRLADPMVQQVFGWTGELAGF